MSTSPPPVKYGPVIFQWKPKAEWINTPQGNLPCRRLCKFCRVLFSRSTTQYINTVNALPGGWLYLCDDCAHQLHQDNS